MQPATTKMSFLLAYSKLKTGSSSKEIQLPPVRWMEHRPVDPEFHHELLCDFQ